MDNLCMIWGCWCWWLYLLMLEARFCKSKMWRAAESPFFITNQAWDIEKWSGENCRSTWDVVCSCNQNTFLCSILMNYGGVWPRKMGNLALSRCRSCPSMRPSGRSPRVVWRGAQVAQGLDSVGPAEGSSGILQDRAENMEKDTKKTDFSGKEKRD